MHVRRAYPALGLVMFAMLFFARDSLAQSPEPSGDVVIVRFAVEGGVATQPLVTRADGPPWAGRTAQLPVPEGMETEEYLRLLRRSPLVESAQADPRVYATAVPNDPLYSSSSGRQDAYLKTIGAPEAWDLATGNDEVIVAILDSGADLTHPDLVAQFWTNQGEIPGNGIDDDANGCIDDVHGCRFMTVNSAAPGFCNYNQAQDLTGAVADDTGGTDHSHGTIVSGIVGASGNNSLGVTGVAWNIRLMIVKVLDCDGEGSMLNVAEGIDYATRMGAQVINLSLASLPGSPESNIPELRTAIEQARDRDVLIVASAGNHGSSANHTPGYPAAYTQYENVIGVGASDWKSGNVWAPFSSYGPGIDFAAPGTSITSTIRQGVLQQNYGLVESGTSFSAPLVTGMFALLIARNADLPFSAYIDAAVQTAQPAPPASHGGNWAGAGIIDIGQAITRIPMLLTGSAQHNWLDIPAGAVMEARVSGRVCGLAVSESFGGSTRSVYELTVMTEAVSIGCGAPGKEVTVFIDGQPAKPVITWGGQDVPLSLTQTDVSTVTPDPGPIVVQPLTAGWNNIAHLAPTSPLPSGFDYLPGNWTAAYAWDPLLPVAPGVNGAYRRVIKDPLAPAVASTWETASRYQGYWVDAQTTTNAATVNPDPPSGRIITFEPGWNNFTWTGESSAMKPALANIAGKYTIVLQHDNTTGEWATYAPNQPRPLNSLGGLLHLSVYWIYMNEPGSVIMN